MQNKKIVKRGRRTKLVNDTVRQKILEYISQGNYINTACLAAGIKAQTFCNWRNWASEYESNPSNGNEHKKIYFEFFEELKNAEAKGEVNLVGRVHDAGRYPNYWPANMRILESRNKEHWGKAEVPIAESKVLIALHDSFSQLKHVAKHHLDDVKQIPQEGVTEKEGDEE